MHLTVNRTFHQRTNHVALNAVSLSRSINRSRTNLFLMSTSRHWWAINCTKYELYASYKSLACELKILSRSSCPSIVVIIVVGCRCNRWIQHKRISQLEIWKTSQSSDMSQSCLDVNSSSFDSLVSNVNGQYLRMKIKMLW